MANWHPKYFTFAELTATNTGIPNVPTWRQIENLKRLGDFLDVVREEFGAAIRVNCAFRCEAVNAAVGGVPTSAHLDGLAADICAWSGKEVDNRRLLDVLRTFTFDQLIHYHKTPGVLSSPIRFIHVGYMLSDGSRRMQVFCK